MLPIEFLERMEKMLGNDYRAFLESYDKEQYKALRFNALRGNREGFLKENPFYAESGGQVSDTGMIIGDNFKARVVDVFKAPNGQHIHKVRLLDGVISVGDECELVLDKDRRKKTEANHSSVHILQYALQQVVSNTIKQAGSYVDDKRLRFDFNHYNNLSNEEILSIESLVNEQINNSLDVKTLELSKEASNPTSWNSAAN